MDSSSKEIAVLHENYKTNDMLARALIQLLPHEERPVLIFWLDKLQTIGGDQKALMTRNEYSWILLCAIKSGKLVEPFDRLPPVKDLPPISGIMPPHLFEEMLTSPEQNLSWIDDLISGTNIEVDEKGASTDRIPPQKFLERQPQPVNGITCYFSVFSKPA